MDNLSFLIGNCQLSYHPPFNLKITLTFCCCFETFLKIYSVDSTPNMQHSGNQSTVCKLYEKLKRIMNKKIAIIWRVLAWFLPSSKQNSLIILFTPRTTVFMKIINNCIRLSESNVRVPTCWLVLEFWYENYLHYSWHIDENMFLTNVKHLPWCCSNIQELSPTISVLFLWWERYDWYEQ